MAYRRRVLEKVPATWVLDGHFIGKDERARLATVQVREDMPEPLLGSPCSMFLSQVESRAPTKNQVRLTRSGEGRERSERLEGS